MTKFLADLTRAARAKTAFFAFRFHAAKRFSASVTHASSTAVSGSRFICTNNHSATRSRLVAGDFLACFSSATARAVIAFFPPKESDSLNRKLSKDYPVVATAMLPRTLSFVRACLRRMNDFQPKHVFEWIKVAIVMEQRVSFHETKRRDETIDSPPDGSSCRAKSAIVRRRFYREFDSSGFVNFELQQLFLNGVKLSIRPNSLQDFAENEVGETQPFSGEIGFKPFGTGGMSAPKVVDPHSRIDDDHEAALTRPSRMMLRSPSHAIFPRKRRTPS